jgi:hypothetical protein
MENSTSNLDHLRLKLGVRRSMLKMRDLQCRRSTLLNYFPWASVKLFDAVIDDCKRDGTITETKGELYAVVYHWHEEAIR